MTLGILFAALIVVGIAAVYHGGIFLLLSDHSPLRRRRRETAIDRMVARETWDLDRRFAELTRSMRHRD